MTPETIECRGRKEICALLRVKSWETAKKVLLRLNVLKYDGTKPVLSVEAYREAAKKR